MAAHTSSWADQVDEEEEAEGTVSAAFGVRFEPRDGWHEGLNVARGQSKQRLDLQHGFMRDIVSVGARNPANLYRTGLVFYCSIVWCHGDLVVLDLGWPSTQYIFG